MKTHKLFLLALTALCSLGVWGETATWSTQDCNAAGFNPTITDSSLPGLSGTPTTKTQNDITLSASKAAMNNADLYNIGYWGWSAYELYTSDYVTIKVGDDLEIKEVTILCTAPSNPGFKIDFYEAEEGEKLETYPITAGSSSDQPCTISNIPSGAHFAKIYDSNGAWKHYLYGVSVTAESAAPAGPTHQVIYAAGGAQGTVPATKNIEETKSYKLAQPSNLTYDGHLFTGWKTEGDETIYPVGTEFTMGTADVTYTAQWEIDYTATWGHFHSATPLRPFPSATSDVLNKIKITTSIASRTSDCPAASDVCGWGVSGISFFVASNAETDYLDIQFTTPEYIIEKVEASTATGLFNIQYASSSSYDSNFNLEGPKQLPNNNPANIQVIGAVAAPDGARSARITPTGTWAPLYYLKVYAKLAPYFDVTYNAGGATGTAPADDKAYVGATYTLAEPTELEKTGFVFTGWKSSIDEEVYAAGTSLEITDDVEFTAQWAEDLDDPTITFRDTIYVVDESNLDLSKLFKSNSTGAVTYTIKDAGTTGAAISGTTFTATATGTAIVTASQARVEGEWNAASVDATITVKAYAKTVNFQTLASGSPSISKTLESYNYAISSLDNVSWDDGLKIEDNTRYLSFLVKANQKVTIKVAELNGGWSPNEAYLTLNGGDPITIQHNTTTSYTTEEETLFVISTIQNPDPRGSIWVTWNIFQEITITDMSPKKVSFDTHGGIPATIEPITEASFNAGITLPDAPTKTDYIFDGWYTAATGGTLAGNAGENYKPADNCTLHAHWAQYATTANFYDDATKYGSGTIGVAHVLDSCHYSVMNLGDGVEWDAHATALGDHGLKFGGYGYNEFSFWVAANQSVTIQMGFINNNYGAGTTKLYINGVESTPFNGAASEGLVGPENGPYITTEETQFVIKFTSPFWSLIQKITIEDAPLSEVIISDQAEDNSVLVANEGKTINVQLERAFTGGMFNTICLPFDLSADQIAASDLADAQIIQLVSTSLESQKLYLEYEEVEAIEAGKGYLIAPVADVENPSFEAVTISKTEATTETIGAVTVNPTFIISTIPAAKENLYLYQNNTFYYPNNELQIDGLRLYYHVNGEANLMPARMRMVQRTTPTDINIFPYEGKTEIGSAKFIHHGHLYILRDGKRYNAHGQIVK